MTREPIYAGVFAYFSALTSGGSPLFVTATRKPTHWEQVPPEDQPALLMRQKSEHAEQRKFLPTKWTLEVELLVYVWTGDGDTTTAGERLNPLLDAIEEAFVIDDTVNGTCTLGGLVNYAAPSGTTQIFLGGMGDEAVAIVPIRILVNA